MDFIELFKFIGATRLHLIKSIETSKLSENQANKKTFVEYISFKILFPNQLPLNK